MLNLKRKRRGIKGSHYLKVEGKVKEGNNVRVKGILNLNSGHREKKNKREGREGKKWTVEHNSISTSLRWGED